MRDALQAIVVVVIVEEVCLAGLERLCKLYQSVRCGVVGVATLVLVVQL